MDRVNTSIKSVKARERSLTWTTTPLKAWTGVMKREAELTKGVLAEIQDNKVPSLTAKVDL